MTKSRQPTSLKKTRTRLRRVPVQLHAELSEYASLLRAIRSNETSDLTGELIRAGKRQRDEEEEESIAHRVRKRPRISTTLDESSGQVQDVQDSAARAIVAASDSPTSKSKRSKKRNQGDISTWWPLFPEHCPTPEFDFEEEITTVAEEWFRDHNRSSLLQDASTDATENDGGGTSGINDTTQRTPAINDDSTTSPSLNIPPLLLSTNTFLNTLLSKLARHRLRVCHVEKGRAGRMQWVDVLEIVGSMGNPGFDFETLERIQNRLCEIYGPEECIALKSFQVISKSKQAMQEMDKKYQSTLFDGFSIPKGIRKKMQALERAKEDEGEDYEEEEEEEEEEKSDKSDDEEDKTDESRSEPSTSNAAERPEIHSRARSTSGSEPNAPASDSENVASRLRSDSRSDSSSESDLPKPTTQMIPSKKMKMKNRKEARTDSGSNLASSGTSSESSSDSPATGSGSETESEAE